MAILLKKLSSSFLFLIVFFPGHMLFAQEAHGGGAGHSGEFSELFMLFALVLIAALVGRYLARKVGQPAVLGELIIGILLGLVLFWVVPSDILTIRHHDKLAQILRERAYEDVTLEEATNHVLSQSPMPEREKAELRELLHNQDDLPNILLAKSLLLLSQMGVLLLLFMVGLESSVEDLVKNGKSSVVVAILGVIVPFFLGFLAMWLLLPSETDLNVPIFVGATLTATSIGITARVFRDLGKLHLQEAKIVLGAAVIDDILGLVVLAVVTGIITSGSLDVLGVGLILLKSLLFVGLVILFGQKYFRQTLNLFARLDRRQVHLLFPFVLLMALAWLADLIGLASIVGAFAAGLIIKEDYFRPEMPGEDQESPVESIIAPIEGIFAPVFFVLMGLQVDVTTFANLEVLGIGLLLTLVAVIGKVIAGIFLPKYLNKWIVGIGMVPRGEVGLIFAGIGKSLGVVSAEMFSIIIIMVMLTTLLTPPLLKLLMDKRDLATA